MTRAEAQDELDKFKDDLKRPAPVEVPGLTFEAAITRYLAEKRKDSIAEDRRILGHLIRIPAIVIGQSGRS